MNTKAMEAAQEITDTHMVLSQATDDIEAVTKEVAAIISKHFPGPSVPVSELEALRKQRDAALKLADLWEGQAIKYPLENATSLVSPYTAEAVAVGQAVVRACANELRAIFAQKEQA